MYDYNTIILASLAVLVLPGLNDASSLSFNYTGTIVSWEFRQKCSSLGGQILLNDTCYYSAGAALDHGDAKDFCSTDGAHLLSLNTLEEKRHLLNEGFMTTPTWLNLESFTTEKLTWADGFTSQVDPRILNVSAGVPSSPACTLFSPADGSVTEPVCTDTATATCKLRYFYRCYPGWAYERNETQKCYRVFGSSYDPSSDDLGPATLADAQAVCGQYEEGHLVSTFAGSFYTSWHPFWNTLPDFDVWVGIFFNAASTTLFVGDEGAVINYPSFLKFPMDPNLYSCSFYNRTEPADIIQSRLYPGEGSDCTLATKLYICETGPHSGIFPGGPATEEPLDTNTHDTNTSLYYRSQLYQIMKDRRLGNEMVHNGTARSKTACAMNCINHGACVSFNFYPQGDGEAHVCELNDAKPTSGLQTFPEYSGFYYGREILIPA